MQTRQAACENAVINVRQGVNADSRFPRNVFVGEWTDFFFFDSDWMRDFEFVEYIKAFLDVEGGTCVGLVNLDSKETISSASANVLLIQGRTTSAEYQAWRMRPSSTILWAEGFARLGCASDTGDWCMYCEPRNEIAVVAFRQSHTLERYRVPMARFHAARFEEAIQGPLSYGFSDRALSLEWRREFLREYATRT